MAEGEMRGRGAVQVEPVGRREPRRVPVGGPEGDQDRSAGGEIGAAERDGLRGEPEGGRAHRGVVAEQLVQRGGDVLGVSPHAVQFARGGEEREKRVAEGVGGGLVSGHEQQDGQGDQVLLAHVVVGVARRDELVEERVAGVLSSAGDEPGRVGGHGVRGGVDDRGVSGREQPRGPALDIGPLGLRHSEQLADHGDRERCGETGHEVDGSFGGPLVEQAVGGAGDERAQPLDAAGGESHGHQPAQPGVVGRVAGQHGVGDRGMRSAP
ncbi:hypothetical protein ADK33_07220 [Streptomyces griseus subsp. rhodochrous]|nr:hypothetical protein ADK33_07220 [Streptomyces griseus subsp. rhodochrous]